MIFYHLSILLASASADTSRIGIINTIAGTGVNGHTGDNGAALLAKLSVPESIVIDNSGNIIFPEWGNHTIRMITIRTGIITTLGGTGVAGYNGDGKNATLASLNQPHGISIDALGDIYIADSNNHRIRKITMSSGIITTVSGTGIEGYGGDGGQAISAILSYCDGVAVNKLSGNIYIADSGNHRIRMISSGSGVITTVAGTGVNGYGGDGGQATSALFNYPQGITINTLGDIYIMDTYNNIVRMITKTSGIITAVAGNSVAGYSGDGDQATSAMINTPWNLAIDTSGDIYFTEQDNHIVRKVTKSTGIITTFAGTAGVASYAGDGDQATSALLHDPHGIALDSFGNILIADINNQRIRMIATFDEPTGQPTSQPSRQPSMQPSSQPSSQPSCQPSSQPSSQPSRKPSSQPSVQPSRQPSSQPSQQPSSKPSGTSLNTHTLY
jgi:hypothetical protein